MQPLAPGPRPVQGSDHDVVVVGGGAAGLSAALVLGRSRRRVLVVDAGRTRNRFSGHVQGYLGHDGITPEALVALGRAEVERYGVALRTGQVTRLLPTASRGPIEVTLDDGATVTARRVLVASGLTDDLPAIPGVAERWGRDVLHCPYCHGWEVRDRRLVVVATRPEEVAKALTVSQWSDDVRVVLHGFEVGDLEPATEQRLAAVGVPVHPGPIRSLQVHADALTGVLLDGGTVVACDAVVVQPRLIANDALLVEVGVEVAAGEFGEFVVSDENGATGVPGIWVAGNVCEPQAQVVTAAAAGHRAAVAIDHDLLLEDVDRAVADSSPRSAQWPPEGA